MDTRDITMIKTIKTRAGTVGELFGYLWKRKMWWLIPMIVVLIIFVGFLALAMASPALSPFVYTLF
jgi:hypothetical protein